MAPGRGRKRSERPSTDAGENRPSPYRPQNAPLAQHDRGQEGGDGNRRSSRGGPGGSGGRGGRRNDNRDNNPNNMTVSSNRAAPAGPMSPPSAPRPSSASATQTPVATPTPTTDVAPPTPKSNPPPFDYTFVTDERIGSWNSTGKQEVISLGTQARQDEDTTDLSAIFQELTRSALDGRLDAVDAGNCVKEIIGPNTSSDEQKAAFDPPSFFLDVLSMIFEAEDEPVPTSLRPFAAATGISPVSMRYKLDAKFLQELGLTQKTFIRQGVRQATNLLYRQANYNLLREEPEGYSKLITELFTTPESGPPTNEVVVDAFERVKALIGTFDLDVGRVLDITMDCFAAILIKYFRFFVKFLRVSSWWPRDADEDVTSLMRYGGLPTWALPNASGWMPTDEDEIKGMEIRSKRDTVFWIRAREVGLAAFFELGGGQPLDEASKARLVAEKTEDEEMDADREWKEQTGTCPPSGNRVAAQLLGFKLRFYASDARDKEDVLPANLIYLTALLIKIGFISLRDLYPHLWPHDADMPAVREKKRRELEEKERLSRPGGGMNALMMAGALSDDTLPGGGRGREKETKAADPATEPVKVDESEKLDEPTDQKVQLLICLLTIGAIPEALFILGRFPWLPEAYPEVIDLINRLLNYSIKDVYDACRPVASQPVECSTKQVPDLDQTGVPKGQVRLNSLPARKPLRWPFPEKSDTGESGATYRFYWDEWTDKIPVCQSVDDVFTLCSTFLNVSGVYIGKDAQLLSKLARIGTKSLAEDRSQQNLDRWQDLLKRLLVPALSHTKANTSMANEIYDLLRFYPVHTRFSIYAEWFEGQISRLPAMKIAFARTRLETQSTMKRISVTNLTAMAKTLSKTAYSSPGVVFSIALSQIEAYTNLTEVVVECAKYFTDLGYDVLVWSLLSALGGKDRNRNNAEFALLPSRWLLALASFSGKVYRRYGIMNLQPILQYVNYQLYRGNSTDLVILKELIAQMAGIVPDTDYTDAQLLAMTGGEVLRKQTLIMLRDKRFESTKTSKRLMRALTDTSLAPELLISIAQHRQSAIYKISDADAHIKLLATMIDDANSILSQYIDLLRSNLTPEEFDKFIPGIPELMIDFGIEPTLTFMIGRASIAYRLSKVAKPKMNGTAKCETSTEPTIAPTDQDGDVGMTNGEAAHTKGTPAADGPSPKDDIKMSEAGVEVVENSASPEPMCDPVDPIQEILNPIIDSVKTVLPEDSFHGVTPEYYVTFWMTVSGDIEAPKPAYDAMMDHWTAESKRLSSDMKGDRASQARNVAAMTDAAASKNALFTELGKQMGAARARKAQLLRNKGSWFESSVKAEEICNVLLEKCLIPRLLLSPSDADYCFKMIKFLHENGVPHFRTLPLYIQFFKSNRLRSLIFSCSIREAENLGRFIRLVLKDFARWHSNKALFEKEAWGPKKDLPGFAKSLDENGKPKSFIDHDGGDAAFKPILLRLHKALNAALRDCLDGTEWMHIRNAITVVKQVVDVFPAVDFMGKSLVKQLTDVASRENKVREDLALTANATLVLLKKRAEKWVMIQAFGNNMGASGQNGAAKSPSKTKPNLRPNAPEFKPSSRASSLGVSVPPLTTAMEVEDGEVDDAKLATPITSTAPKATETKPEPKLAPPIESKKSEILDRREAIKREQAAAKAASGQNGRSAIPPRPDITNRHTPLDRASPSLPNRPDAPFPSRDLLDHHPSRHGDRRDGRDSWPVDPRTVDRPGDRTRAFPPNDRRSLDSNPRDSRDSRGPRDTRESRDAGRPSDRSLPPRDSRIPDPPPKWVDPTRDSGDRNSNGARQHDTGRLSRDMPPPRSSNVPADRGPVAPDRASTTNSDRKELVNPERAALISGDLDASRSNSPRRGREDPRERVSSRPQSPRRPGAEKDHHDSRRDDRSSRNGPPEFIASRSRTDEIQPPPAGPRSDRGDRDRSSASERAPFQPPSSNPPFMDPDHGRLNTPARQQADPNFGRLNPTPTPTDNAPSGPRGRDARGNRMPNAPPPRHNQRMPTEAPGPPTPDRQPPTGPASGRHSSHSRRPTNDNIGINTSVPGPISVPVAASAPTPPNVESPVSGIHPERLKQLPIYQGELAQPPVQPSPLNQMQTNHNRSSIPPLTTSTPSGLRGVQSSPSRPSSNNGGVPTGPASAQERAARRSGPQETRMFSGINKILDPNKPSHRERGGRMSGAETPVSAPSTPIIPPPPPGQPPFNAERADLISAPAPSDERGGDRDRSGRRSERSGRQHGSRRSSRSPGRERDSKDERGYRDRRERDGERESSGRHGARSSAIEELLPSSGVGKERESGSGRDRESSGRHGGGRDRESSSRNEGGQEASWGGERGGHSGSGRSRDIRGGGEERRDSRGTREDGGNERGGGGRKRHSEEGMERGGRESKRPRR